VPAHSAGAVALVIIFAGLLGGEGQAADGAEKGGGWLHSGGSEVVVLLFSTMSSSSLSYCHCGVLGSDNVQSGARVM
jgi:hypothetical protein